MRPPVAFPLLWILDVAVNCCNVEQQANVVFLHQRTDLVLLVVLLRVVHVYKVK